MVQRGQRLLAELARLVETSPQENPLAYDRPARLIRSNRLQANMLTNDCC